MTKCPKCGYEDPFHPSWFDIQKEVAEPCYFVEWNDVLYEVLKNDGTEMTGDTEMEGYVYHLTKKHTTVERTPLEIVIQNSLYGKPPQEKAHRKNYHLIGFKLSRSQKRVEET